MLGFVFGAFLSATATVGPPTICVAHRVCIINYNMGGEVLKFQSFADAMRTGNHRLVINGPCVSSCMSMADRARPHTCITPNATFGYHLTSWNRPIPLSHDLDTWVRVHGGGYPPGPSFNVMPNSEARRFWPMCKG